MASSEQMTSQDLLERDALLMIQHSITPYSSPASISNRFMSNTWSKEG
jgi:hypothetical protein